MTIELKCQYYGDKDMASDKLSKEELLNILRKCQDDDSHDDAHIRADNALMEFINDGDIKDAYEKIYKWYN
jgi:hypothetical protein